jgi:hypothetical protein
MREGRGGGVVVVAYVQDVCARACVLVCWCVGARACVCACMCGCARVCVCVEAGGWDIDCEQACSVDAFEDIMTSSHNGCGYNIA